MKPNFEPAKGARDWYGSECIIRDFARDTLRSVFERYGYSRLETPPIENVKSLGHKGGGEIQKEVFRLRDQGGRDLALRFDQTVPLARFVGSNSDIVFPFKRYVIGEVFRDGPTQPEQGRYRTFTQCDVDVLGIREMSAEAELLTLAQDAFEDLGLGGVEVNVNNRKLLDGILDSAGIPVEARQQAIVVLDKMDKIGEEGVRQELGDLTLFGGEKVLSGEVVSEVCDAYRERGVSALDSAEIRTKIIRDVGQYGYNELRKGLESAESGMGPVFVGQFATRGPRLVDSNMVSKVMDVVSVKGTNDEVLRELEKGIKSERGVEGLNEVKQVLQYASDMGVDFVKVNPVLARGLDYYTGTTIEVYLKDRKIVSSAILAGGRFDDMVGDFRGGEDIPAVGFSFGLERLSMILAAQRKFPGTTTEVYVIPIGNENIGPALKYSHLMRRQGLKVDTELRYGGKTGKSIGYASKQGIPYVALVGSDEVSQGIVQLKDLRKREQTGIPIGDVAAHIRSENKGKL